jgi:hypothetical protein
MHFIPQSPFFGTYLMFPFRFFCSDAVGVACLQYHARAHAWHGNALVGDRSGATSVPTVDEHGDALDHGAERRLPHARPMTADATLVST